MRLAYEHASSFEVCVLLKSDLAQQSYPLLRRPRYSAADHTGDTAVSPIRKVKRMKTILQLTLLTVALSALTACAAEDSSDVAVSTETLHRQKPGGSKPRKIALATGVTLSYVEQGDRDGDVVIFLHGYTDSHHSFDLTLPGLPKRFHAYALDQRGHGDSDKPASGYTQADFAGDVVAFLDALHIRRAALVGHSMGSLIAHYVAAISAPQRITKLVLIGSAPTAYGNPVAADLQAAVAELSDPIDPAFVRDFQSSTFFRPIPDSYLDTAVEESLKVPAAIWQQALDGLIEEDHSTQLRQIRARTRIVWGDQDVFFSRADQDGLVSAIPRSTLSVYVQTGHGLHAERPERFNAELARFLSE